MTCSNYGLPRRRSTWVQLLSWLTKRTYKIIILTCLMLAWERYGTLRIPVCAYRKGRKTLQFFLFSLYCARMQCATGTCEAIPGGEGTEHWVQQGLQMVALVWYFVPRFKLVERGAQAFGRRRTVLSQNLQRPFKSKAD